MALSILGILISGLTSVAVAVAISKSSVGPLALSMLLGSNIAFAGGMGTGLISLRAYEVEKSAVIGGIAKREEAIEVTVNHDGCTFFVPKEWEDRYVIEERVDEAGNRYADIYCRVCYEAETGAEYHYGLLFSVWNTKEDYTFLPDYVWAGTWETDGNIVLVRPTDVQFDGSDPKQVEEYQEMSAQIEEIFNSVFILVEE